MAFIKHVSEKWSEDQDVKVKIKNNRISIRLGAKVCQMLSLTNADRIDFFYDDENPRKWLIKKGESYCVSKTASETIPYFIGVKIIPDLKTLSLDHTIRPVCYKFQDGGIAIDLDGEL